MESEGTSRKIKAAEHTLRLPEEIIEEILSRLPVKSLLKFRCVSKSWRNLIGSDRFIKTHLKNSTKNPNFPHHRIILNPSRSNGRLKHCSVRSLLNEPLIDSFTFANSINTIRLVGCCNGLVCVLLDRKYFMLWNPSRRMSKKLPNADNYLMLGMLFTKYGFGYVESSGDYKIFAIFSLFCTSGQYRATGKVYSLKTNSWKTRQDRDASPFDEVGKFVSGSLHWERGYGDNWDIASFDLKSEVYGTVERPSCLEDGDFQPFLGVLDGYLCVLCDYQRTRTDVWVMKQYGVRDSWSKVVTIPYVQYPFKGRILTPLCICSNGEILLACGSSFISYCPEDHVFRYHRITDIDSLCEVGVCVDSLVSLF